MVLFPGLDTEPYIVLERKFILRIATAIDTVVINNTLRFATAIFSSFYSMANTALIKDMLDNAVHIGHKRQFWSAKMRDYIYGIQNNIHVFDLYKTETRITEVKKALEEATSKGKVVLIVGTKLQARDTVKAIAEETGNYYINTKWVPGLLTNFPTIKKRIAAYNQIEKDLETGALEMLTKKEKASKLKELEKLRKAYEGIKDIKKTPDILLVVDGHYESLALEEARTLSIPTYALLGSTGDIDRCTDFVPSNVNSIKSIKFVLDYLKTAIKRTKKTEGGVMGRTEKLAPKSPVTETPSAE
jgi:small subunit ribosomal protein S2